MNEIKYHMITLPNGKKHKLSDSAIAYFAWLYLYGQHSGTISPGGAYLMIAAYKRANELGIEPSNQGVKTITI